MKGIYQYMDLNTGDVVYVGKDSYIDKHKRHKDHLRHSMYDDQPINRILQNNPERYEYSIIWETEDCTTLKLNKMEILFGKIHDPKFNFDKFGRGGCNGCSEETKNKISASKKGINFSEEHKIKLSESHNTIGYYCVSKEKHKTCKQGYIFTYRYYDENGKQKKIRSVSIEKLEQKVKAKGLKWKKLEGE